MTEHGLLFTQPMALAAHEGRKTVTRRIITSRHFRPRVQRSDWDLVGKIRQGFAGDNESPCYPKGIGICLGHVRCPYGVPGDTLVVKEKHWRFGWYSKKSNGQWTFLPKTFKTGPRNRSGQADRDHIIFHKPNIVTDDRTALGYHKRPPLFLPFAYARTRGRITDIRAERLQEITEEDAILEGLRAFKVALPPNPPDETITKYGLRNYGPQMEEDPVAAFHYHLWNPINAKRGSSWESNPFVWRIQWELPT